MRHNTPIYFTNVKVDIFNRTKVDTFIETVTIEKVVLKGFSIKDMIQRNTKSILSKLPDVRKLGKNEVAKISNLELLVQLGYGVNE